MADLKTEQGKRIAEIRRKSGDTQQECADKLGVKRATLSAYEVGNNSMPYELLSKFVGIYGTSYDYIISGEKKAMHVGREDAANYGKKDILSLLDAIDDSKLSTEIRARVFALLEENAHQKDKIISLLEKQEKMIQMIQDRLGFKMP